MKTFLLLLFLGFYSYTFGQTPKGDRILAWSIDMAENNNYDSAYYYAEQGCLESVHLSFSWNNIELDSGDYSTSYINNVLNVANYYYPTKETKVELQIPTMNTNVKVTPADLISVDFDDPLMINRFKTLLDTLFKHIPDIELAALNIGNESDIYIGTDSIQYVKYRIFLDSVIPYAKELYYNLHSTNLKVGTTFTFNGLTHFSTASLCKLVNQNLDIVSVTYYPLNNDFTMQSPNVVQSNFNSLVSEYPNISQPIYLVECGYSSSSTCNSSEELQAQFYRNVFDAWDVHYNNIKYLSIFKSTDWSQQETTDLGNYYGINDTIFLEYLRTLGVRTWDENGTNKLSYETILCELIARDWCNAYCEEYTNFQDKEKSLYSLFPNPVKDILNIETSEEYLNFILYDYTGKIVLESKSKVINLTKLVPGIYFFSLKLKSELIQTKRLIKL